jgi:hypothetical protein
MTAVEYDPVRIVEMRGEIVNADEGTEHGGEESEPASAARDPKPYSRRPSSRRRNSWKCSMPSSIGDW